MKVYVFGNEYVVGDKRAIEVAKELDNSVEGISFVFVRPNEDLPLMDERHVVILDTVRGIQDVLAIPVAAGVLFPAYGIILRPEFSALLMSVSSIIVAVNAVLLKGVEDDVDGPRMLSSWDGSAR